MSEGKSTGIPTIQEELRKNGSPRAAFTTDEDRRAVTVEIPIHPTFLGKTSIDDGKSVVSDSKVSIAPVKSVVSAGNAMFEALLNAMSCGEKVKGNIRKLYDEYDGMVFGRTDISSCLVLSSSAAIDLEYKGHAVPCTANGTKMREISDDGKRIS